MNTKKIFTPVILLSTLFLPFLAKAAIVQCDTNCGFQDLLDMLGRIYTFIIEDIATPLAVVAVMIGGVLILISAGNANLLGIGKKVFWSAIIGMILAWCSWLIINTVLTAMGVSGLGG